MEKPNFLDLLKPECIKSVKISVLISVILVGISVSWLDFDEFRLHNSSKIYFFFTPENWKRRLFVLLHTSPNASMLGWFLCFTIDLIIGPLILLKTGSHLVYSGILRFETVLEKKVLKTRAVSCSFKIMSSLPINVIFLVNSIFSDKNRFTFF